MPQKRYRLKPDEVIKPEEMEIGVVYEAAIPLREYKWAVKSDCCGFMVYRIESEEEKAAAKPALDLSFVGEDEEEEEYTPIPKKEERVMCMKCQKECQKVWYKKSRLIACLSRPIELSQKWHEKDDF